MPPKGAAPAPEATTPPQRRPRPRVRDVVTPGAGCLLLQRTNRPPRRPVEKPSPSRMRTRRSRSRRTRPKQKKAKSNPREEDPSGGPREPTEPANAVKKTKGKGKQREGRPEDQAVPADEPANALDLLKATLARQLASKEVEPCDVPEAAGGGPHPDIVGLFDYLAEITTDFDTKAYAAWMKTEFKHKRHIDNYKKERSSKVIEELDLLYKAADSREILLELTDDAEMASWLQDVHIKVYKKRLLDDDRQLPGPPPEEDSEARAATPPVVAPQPPPEDDGQLPDPRRRGTPRTR
ncbi:hypothetical protein DFJ74DRAFT_645065 [Hyaloraphidium curvatum]|nr:hypothetical protein DFJ74DRAFT_645065 [Hyaloraphidium curvatum]